MITLTTWSDLAELLDLIYELTEEGMSDDEAFVAACAELPVLLDLDTEARYVPSRVVMFERLAD